MSQLKKGAVLSYMTIILTNVIGILLTPFIIKSLGDAEYGLYTLIGAFVGYISVMDLGLNQTIVRFVAKYRAEQDKKSEENFLATTMMIYGVIALAVVAIGAVLFLNLESIFGNSLKVDELAKAKVMFVILIFNISITLPGGAFRAISNGYEKFVFPRAVNIFRYLLRSASVVALLLFGGDAIGMVVLDTIMNLLVMVIMSRFVLKKLKVVFKLHSFQIPLVKEIFSYSIWIFLLVLVYQFQWKGGQVILGIKTDTVTVAVYAVGILLGTYYSSFASAINGVFLPRAMQMVVNKISGTELTKTTIKIGRITLIMLFAILGAFVLYGKQFIDLWVGKTYIDAWLIALLIMITSTNILVLTFADSTLKAKNLFKYKGITYISLIILGTIIGYYLIDYFGSLGMIIGICISWATSQILVTVYYKKKLGFMIKTFYRGLLNKLLIIFLVTLLIGRLIEQLITLNSWLGFFLKVSFFGLCYFLLMFLFGMNEYERSLVLNILKRKSFK